MTDFPAGRLPPPPVMTPWSPDSIGFVLGGLGAWLEGTASRAWPTANTAVFVPFTLFDSAVAYQLLFYVGATSSGNIDVGIYDSELNRIVSAGSTAMSATTNTVQEINIADTLLSPGGYYMAAGCDNATGTCFGYGGTADEIMLSSVPLYVQTGLSGPTLTNPGTPAISTEATPPVFVFGIQFRSVF